MEESTELRFANLRPVELKYRVFGQGESHMIGNVWVEGDYVVWVDNNCQKNGIEIKVQKGLSGLVSEQRQQDTEDKLRVLKAAGYVFAPSI